ncbi:3-isopropylmalate dehydratase small subunit [Acidobacteria bacterium AH-259-O06]|nr:3-isopropylmalate dehydratase small subunit [Acidobacteria bacterium AH-259-O06]
MQPFAKHKGLVATLDLVNVDTDQIIPKQFLKRIERTGYGQFLFYDWRFNEDGSLNPDFELNQPRFKAATILLTRANFGCGSSREHAPWALLDHGFRSILAPSFADIFYNNCFKNSLLPVRLSEEQVEELFGRARANLRYQLTIDLQSQTITDQLDLEYHFEVDSFHRECLLKGLDEIGLTLQYEDQIREYERRREEGARSQESEVRIQNN